MADPNHAADMVAFEQWFNQKHPLSQDIEQAKNELPMFKGETITADNAPEGTENTDQWNRPIIKKGGKWVLKSEVQE